MNGVAAKRPAIWLKLLVGAVAAIVLVAAGAVLFKAFLGDSEAEVGQEHVASSEDTMAAKAAIEARNPNATSITFDKVFNHWTGDIVAICGRVDIIEAQDSFDGPERFVYADGELTLEEADGSDAVAQKWDDLCD